MTTVTIERIEAAQAELAKMIEQLKQQQAPTAYAIDAAEITLAPGEHYAGIVLDEDGNVSHHLVLMPGQAEGVTWDKARDWAESIGGVLPTRQEQALLYANLKGKFESAWYWSDEQYEGDGSFAWYQYFGHGYQGFYRKSYEGRARAVRRFTA